MAAVTTQEWTFQLPQEIIEMLRKAAAERKETPDQIVAEALLFSLQPVRQEALRRLNSQIHKQQSQSAIEIQGHLESHLTDSEQKRLSQLLDHNRTKGLNQEEQNEMQQLFDRIEAVATEKAAAIWLLSEKSAEASSMR